MKVSVIIPVYNEEKVIAGCLASLAKQTVAKDMEIIVVDDGSTDKTLDKIKVVSSEIKDRKIVIRKQDHKGPGGARNLGASKAKGDILVFVDVDMEFEKDFVANLITPIISGQTIGTFSKEEYLLNKDNRYARYWNLNLGRKAEMMLPENYPDKSPVFRAILKSEFQKAGGFDVNVGYTDDWTVSRKIDVLATVAIGAKFYHRNPENLAEVWRQARWFGKNEFLTGSFVRKIYNLLRYCPLWAIFRIYDPNYFLFTIIYNSAVFTSVCLAFLNEQKHR